MTAIRCWQVDAFTSRPFGGNSAAICWLDQEADPDWMQAVAMEMNLAETAFVRRLGEHLELRWFTPTVEVDLCGHATLATAHALWDGGLATRDQTLKFQTRSGLLTANWSEGFIELDFPALPPTAADPPPGLLESLGVSSPKYVGKNCFDYLVELEDEAAVRRVCPDFTRLRTIPMRGVIVTAPAATPEFDCASRFFAPAVGVDEDPVCGSAHCCLAVYWSNQIGRDQVQAHQVSARGGELRLRLAGDRVRLGGQAVTVWEGRLLATSIHR